MVNSSDDCTNNGLDMPGVGYVGIHEVNQHQATVQWVQTKSEFVLSCTLTINFLELKVQGPCTNNLKTFCQIDGPEKKIKYDFKKLLVLLFSIKYA